MKTVKTTFGKLRIGQRFWWNRKNCGDKYTAKIKFKSDKNEFNAMPKSGCIFYVACNKRVFIRVRESKK